MFPILPKLAARHFAALNRVLRALRHSLAPSRPAASAAAPESATLRALTAAALALPGLAPTPAPAAPGDTGGFQYGHYKETPRTLYDGIRSAYSPIQVDNINANGNLTLWDRWKFAFNFIQDTWSGATPIATAPNALGGNNAPSANPNLTGATPLISGNGTLMYDKQFNTYRLDQNTGDYVLDNRLVHTIAVASPETRQQGDFKLGYEWDETAISFGGGLSEEPDYHSAFANLGGVWNLNQKLTTLSLTQSYTNSDITANINPDSAPYIDYSAYADKIETAPGPFGQPIRTLTGTRQDWSTHFGLTQVINKDALAEAGVGYTRSTGYLANPYKAVEFIFVSPNQTPADMGGGLPPLLTPQVQAVLEQRPDVRNEVSFNARYIQYVDPLDAAAHLGYRFFHDSWDINAHTFDADWVQPLPDGWSITPRFRYYSQSAANFYRPYFLFKSAEPTTATGQLDLAQVPIGAYTSDWRLAGFGALSGGITVSKKVGKAITLEGGFEYYTHSGDLKMGGGGEGAYADVNYYQWNAGLKVDLGASSLGLDMGDDAHAHHHHGHGEHSGVHAPAGVMFAHMLDRPGDAMVGYRFMWSQQAGEMLNGTHHISDPALVARGCGSQKCSYAPSRMSMEMHMLDLMYAPTDWLNLMLMPQFMNMDMDFRQLDGAPPPVGETHNHGGAPRHATGGVGDTGLYALFKLWDGEGHHVHATLGFMAPSGDSGLKMPSMGTYYDYGMQLGSGTWDFRPSLTYTGHRDRWAWGAQINAITRLQSHNPQGYVLGDTFQATGWGSYDVTRWLAASLRGIYTAQGKIDGRYNGPASYSATFDYPANYGGHYWDLGMGATAVVPEGFFKGNQIAVEWQQPLMDDVHGYQLERTGTLWATWMLAF